jgi:hypothetical protein
MIAFSLDNLLFLLLIAGAALFQLLSKVVNKAGKSDSGETSSSPTPQTPRPIQRAPRESDADRIRKFLEALGQPTSSTPPPPVLPRTDIPPRPVAPVQPPPTLVPRPWEILREDRRKRDARRKSSPPGQAIHAEEVIPPPVPVPAASAFEVHEGALPLEPQQPLIIKAPVEAYAADARPSAARTDFKGDIATLLASKSSLREVILLREILGTPRGLQAMDATP